MIQNEMMSVKLIKWGKLLAVVAEAFPTFVLNNNFRIHIWIWQYGGGGRPEIFPIFFWGLSCKLFKNSVKGLLIVISTFYGNPCDGIIAGCEQMFCIVNAQGIQVTVKALMKYIAEYP